jgi:transketolase
MLLSNERKVADMREAFGQTLVELGTTHANLVCVGADTTDSLKTKKFGDRFPERMFNIGIAEANLVSIAAGLAVAGKIAIASTYAAFLPGRCLDQIRNAICYPNLNVKLIVSHAGLSVGPDGASHQQIEDISIMRAIPNMRVLVPADATAVRYLIRRIVKASGPFYVRLARPSGKVIYAEDDTIFEIGKGNILREGKDATIMACGLMVTSALEAADQLEQSHGLNCRVIDMYSIKPIDKELIERCSRETGRIVTIEEHNILGGMGGAVAEVTSDTYPVPVKRLGVLDTFGESARDDEISSLFEKYGLSVKKIVETVLQFRRIDRK